jgi:hypothetical protein
MSTIDHRRPWLTAILAAAAIYFGLLAGVSLLATPVKFLAPSLSLPVALDVGRHTFAVLNKVEWAAALVVLSFGLGARARWIVAAAVLILLALAADTWWLLPTLDARVGLIMRGVQPAPSMLHWLYIALDGLKLVLLLAVTGAAAWRLARTAR